MARVKLSFIPEDSIVIINGTSESVDLSSLEVPLQLHAVQLYEDGHTEVEWKDARGAPTGNTFGVEGLPGGEIFLDNLVRLFEEAKKRNGDGETKEEPVAP